MVRQDGRQAARRPVRRRQERGAQGAAHFVDFLRDGGEENEETGEELPPPQIYEPVAELPRVRERRRRCTWSASTRPTSSTPSTSCSSTTRSSTSSASRASCARRAARRCSSASAARASSRSRGSRRTSTGATFFADHDHEAYNGDQPARGLQAALPAGGRQGQGRRLHLHRQGDQGGGLPRVHQHLPQHGRAARTSSRATSWTRSTARPSEVWQKSHKTASRRGPDARRPVDLLHRARPPPTSTSSSASRPSATSSARARKSSRR